MRLAALWAALWLGAAAMAGDAAPWRGVCWQWCFEMPDPEFRMATLEAMHRAGFNLIMPEFGPLLHDSGTANSIGRAEFREFLVRARQLDLMTVPLVNTLGHGERSPAWPEPLAGGFDLGSERNYEFLFALLDDFREDFAAAGAPMPYLHLGMDEASEVLLANAARYGKSAGELLEAHIARLLDYCRRHGIRMIVWHDMLMGSADPLYDHDMSYQHADRTASWPIRRNLPRDLILMYWNYEPREHYSVADALAAEGFEVWLMPWGAESVRAMTAHADAGGFPAVVVSTWMESGFYSDRVPGDNALPQNRWLMAAIAEAVRTGPGGDPVLDFVEWYFPPPETALPVWRNHPGGLLLGRPLPDPGDWLRGAAGPVTVTGGDGICIAVSGVDRPRGQDEIILYTAANGK